MKYLITVALVLTISNLSLQFYSPPVQRASPPPPEPVCRQVPKEVCNQVPKTTYESVTKKECRNVPDTVCADVQVIYKLKTFLLIKVFLFIVHSCAVAFCSD